MKLSKKSKENLEHHGFDVAWLESLDFTGEPMIKAICPICGIKYRFRKGYETQNQTCSNRECKEILQKGA